MPLKIYIVYSVCSNSGKIGPMSELLNKTQNISFHVKLFQISAINQWNKCLSRQKEFALVEAGNIISGKKRNTNGF